MWSWGKFSITWGSAALLVLALIAGAGEVLPLVILSALCHELGHLTALRLVGAKVEQIRLTAFGAEIRADTRYLSYGREIFCTLAGPAINLILAVVLARAAGDYLLAGANLFLGVFNLLPLPSLDGGRALYLAVSWFTDPLPLFTDPTWARVTVIVVNLWIGIPFTIMQITGILQNIPADQYEAARIDGANWWQTFTRITMPYLVFVLTPYLITTFTGNVNNFNVIYLLSGGNPTAVGDTAGSTDLLITWLYKLTVDRGDYNLGGVIGIFTFVVLAIVSLITYRSSGSYKNEGGFR